MCGAEAHPMSTWRGSWPVESLVKAESVRFGKMYEHVCNQICFQIYQERRNSHSRSFLLVGPARIVWGMMPRAFLRCLENVADATSAPRCHKRPSQQKTTHTPRQNVGFVSQIPNKSNFHISAVAVVAEILLYSMDSMQGSW